MVKLGRKGIAPLIVLAIILGSTGAAVATPVVVDAVGVDPDSPLYGLGRLGEQIRMTSKEEQMKKRWGEYSRMVNRGKGLEYQGILEEFKEKMENVAPGDVEAKKEIVRWMQEQMPGIGLVELKLAKEFTNKAKGLAVNSSRSRENLDNEAETLEDLEVRYLNATPEMRDNILAQLQLIRERLRMMVSEFKDQLQGNLKQYFDIDNLMVDVKIKVKINVGNGEWKPSLENAAEFFNEKLEEFNGDLAEVQTKLEGTPENTPGRQAAERQVELAIKFRDNAVEANNAGNVKKAISLLRTADVHLNNADKILEHAAEWDEDFSEQWKDWEKGWAKLRPKLIENKSRKEIQKNFQENIKDIREQWKQQREIEEDED